MHYPIFNDLFDSYFDDEFIAIFVIVFGIYLVVFIIATIFLFVGRAKLFKKCGQARWKAIVPFYGAYIQDVKIAGLHWMFFILKNLLFLGLYSSIFVLIVNALSFYNLSKKFHKNYLPSTLFGAVFDRIVVMVYGFSSNYVYDEKIKVNNCGFFEKLIK